MFLYLNATHLLVSSEIIFWSNDNTFIPSIDFLLILGRLKQLLKKII